jgi:hypothetical protein
MDFQNTEEMSEITVDDDLTEINCTGYIYVIHNEMYKYYGDDVYKIGKARHIENRLKSYITGYIEPTSLLYSSIRCKNYSVCEREVHKRLQKFRMRQNREFFQVNINIVIEVIDLVVLELNDLDDEALSKYHDDIKDIRKTQTLKPEINENAFEELIQSGKTNDVVLLSNLNILNLKSCNRDSLIKYQSILTDKLKLDEHLNIIQSLMAESFLNPQSNAFLKLKHIRSFEKNLNMKRYQVDIKLDNMTNYTIPDDEYQIICKLFRISRKKPSNKNDLLKMYVSMVRNLTTSEIIMGKQGSDKKMYYKLNTDYLKFHVDLNMFSNPGLINFDADILKTLRN